jgi:hypothetical protein
VVGGGNKGQTGQKEETLNEIHNNDEIHNKKNDEN